MIALALAAGLSLAPAPPPFLEGDEFDALLRRFDEAVAAWEAEDRGTTSAERRAHRERDPVPEFWFEFATLGATGHGPALLWQVQHVDRSGLPLRDRRETTATLYADLFEKHPRAPWMGELLAKLPRRARVLGTETVVGYLEILHADNPVEETRAGAGLALAKLWLREEETEEQGFALLEELAKEFAHLEVGEEAEHELFAARHLRVGGVAANIVGQDVDGNELELADHRGKVVVLDFWGFW